MLGPQMRKVHKDTGVNSRGGGEGPIMNVYMVQNLVLHPSLHLKAEYECPFCNMHCTYSKAVVLSLNYMK